MNEKDGKSLLGAPASLVSRANALEDFASAVRALIDVVRQPLVQVALFAVFVVVWGLVFLSIFR